SCARRPDPPAARRSPRPSILAVATDSRCRPSRAAAGSNRVTETGAIADSAVADGDDLVLDGAAGRVDADFIALMLADQRTRHRRGDRDQPELDVGLEVANDLVAFFLLGLDIGQ